jgi:hypothetical protein
MTSTLKRLRGLKSLVQDAVVQGSRAIERVQVESAARPFSVLEQIEPLAIPARGVHLVHDAVVAGSHGMVRLWTRAIGAGLDVALDVVERRQQPGDPPPPPEEPKR